MRFITRHFFLFVFLILPGVSSLFSQSLSKQDAAKMPPEVFFNKITEQLTAGVSKSTKKEIEKTIGLLYAEWFDAGVSKYQKDAIINLSLKINDKFSSPDRRLLEYFHLLDLMWDDGINPFNFLKWHEYANSLLDNNSTVIKYNDFIKYSKGFFKKGAISEVNKTYSWYYRGTDYSFYYDTSFKIKFKKINLVCRSKKDSSVINNTRGTFDYNTKTWSGDWGTLRWDRFGKNTGDSSYAVFDKYNLNLKQNVITIDSARLYYKRFFDYPLLGLLKDRVSASPPHANTPYPFFKIYQKSFDLSKVYSVFKLDSKLELRGLNLYAIGENGKKPVARIYKNDSIYAVIKSDIFVLYRNKVESPNVEFSFHFAKDSIYHPNLRFMYLSRKNVVILFGLNTKTNEIIPFSDSYHKMDLYVPVFYWDLDKDYVDFQKFKQLSEGYKASFESFNYFSLAEYYSLQVTDQRNPLYLIRDYLKKYDVYDSIIDLETFSRFLRKPRWEVAAFLTDLSTKGFVLYNPTTKTAKIGNKLFHYIRAKQKLADYDAMNVTSKVKKGPNAKFNFKDYSINIYGIPQLTLSDSQAVYLYPKKHTIAVTKNRDFNFDGSIQVGLLNFYVKNTNFVYDSFMLHMNYIDSMAFYTLERDTTKANGYRLNKVKNTITGMVGDLYIDEPGNKSGTFRIPKYPIFANKGIGYVNFDSSYGEDSTLQKKIYYQVDPFVFDSVSHFITNGISFNGTLAAEGVIDNEIKEPLTIMPDNTLGFVHNIPDTGYSVYGHKGRIFGKISVDNNNLIGYGKLDLPTLTLTSDSLLFKPDSLSGIAYNFAVKTDNGFDFPVANGDSLKAVWLTKDTNLVKISTLDSLKLINVFGNSKLYGTLLISPGIMKGFGTFKNDKADVSSKNMRFTSTSVSADSADFTFYDEEHKNKIFVSRGYNVFVDFEKQRGIFKNLNKNENTFIEFPYNRYVSTLNKLEWIMDEKKLILTSEIDSSVYNKYMFLPEKDIINKKFDIGEFISVDSAQDSLRFYAKKGIYDYDNYTISAKGVRFINVANGVVFTNDGNVTVRGKADMDSLFKTRIIADTSTKYHTFYDADIKILSRNYFSGSGYIDYIDINKRAQQIYLSELDVDSLGRIEGEGKVNEDDYFFLNPLYFFKGNVKVFSNKKNYKFKGAFRINEECVNTEDNWVAFEKFIDPDSIVFKIDENTITPDSLPVRFGLAYSYVNHKFYPLILQPLQYEKDNLCINSYGRIFFDTINNSIRVGPEKRLKGDVDAKGNYIKLDEKKCIMTGEGLFDFGTKFNKIKFLPGGKFKHLSVIDSTYFNTAFLLDFYFDEDLLKSFRDTLLTAKGKPVDLEKGPIKILFKELSDNETATRLLVESSLYGKMENVPNSIKSKIIFSDVNFRWDVYSKSYISEGPIGIGYINDVSINKYFDGNIQIRISRTGVEMNIYLKPADDKWYFFSYSYGIMQILSSNEEFNTILTEIKESKRVLNPDDENKRYEYIISTEEKKDDFLRRIERINRVKNGL